MSGGPLAKQRSEATRKGALALAGWGGTVLLFWMTRGWFLPVVGIGVSVWLTWRWFSYRAKWGMRF